VLAKIEPESKQTRQGLEDVSIAKERISVKPKDDQERCSRILVEIAARADLVTKVESFVQESSTVEKAVFPKHPSRKNKKKKKGGGGGGGF